MTSRNQYSVESVVRGLLVGGAVALCFCLILLVVVSLKVGSLQDRIDGMQEQMDYVQLELDYLADLNMRGNLEQFNLQMDKERLESGTLDVLGPYRSTGKEKIEVLADTVLKEKWKAKEREEEGRETAHDLARKNRREAIGMNMREYLDKRQNLLVNIHRTDMNGMKWKTRTKEEVERFDKLKEGFNVSIDELNEAILMAQESNNKLNDKLGGRKIDTSEFERTIENSIKERGISDVEAYRKRIQDKLLEEIKSKN